MCVESGKIITPIDVLPGNLKKFINWENDRQLKHLVNIQTDERFKLTLLTLESSANLLFDITSTRKPKDDNEKTLYSIGTRLFNDIGSSFSMCLKGYFQVALAIQRDIFEIGLLLDYFKNWPSEIKVWQNADDKTLLTKFAPHCLYKEIDDIGETVLKGARKENYKLFCNYAAHPTPKGVVTIVKGNMCCIGPIFDGEKLWNCMFELNKQTMYAIICFAHLLEWDLKYYPLLLKFFKRSSEWSKKFYNVSMVSDEEIKVVASILGVTL